MWLIILLDQLPIVDLVSHYLTNYLMGRELILMRAARRSRTFPPHPVDVEAYPVLAVLSICYPGHKGRLFTCYSPVRRFTREPKSPFTLDLHVLGLPPAFVLSQDQTLQFDLIYIETCHSTSLLMIDIPSTDALYARL